MNFLTGILFVGIVVVLAVRNLFVKAIFNIDVPAPLTRA